MCVRDVGNNDSMIMQSTGYLSSVSLSSVHDFCILDCLFYSSKLIVVK